MAWRRRGLALLIVLTGVAFLPKSAQFAISAVGAQHLRRELQGAVLSPQLPSPLAEFSVDLRCRPAGTKMAAKKPTELEGGGGGEELRTMFSPPWACMAKCGACCYLAPEERDLSGLTDEERDTYIGMAGEDGWCLNFDRATHLCMIYEDRPSFCRIESLGPMYDVPEHELGDFAAGRPHISRLVHRVHLGCPPETDPRHVYTNARESRLLPRPHWPVVWKRVKRIPAF